MEESVCGVWCVCDVVGGGRFSVGYGRGGDAWMPGCMLNPNPSVCWEKKTKRCIERHGGGVRRERCANTTGHTWWPEGEL